MARGGIFRNQVFQGRLLYALINSGQQCNISRSLGAGLFEVLTLHHTYAAPSARDSENRTCTPMIFVAPGYQITHEHTHPALTHLAPQLEQQIRGGRGDRRFFRHDLSLVSPSIIPVQSDIQLMFTSITISNQLNQMVLLTLQ